MSEESKANIHFFESPSMRGLYYEIEEWQKENDQLLLSASIQKDDDMFCCIAFSSPSKILLMNKVTSTEEILSEGKIRLE